MTARRVPMLPGDVLDDPPEFLGRQEAARPDDVVVAREMAQRQHLAPSDAGWIDPWQALSARQQACAVLVALEYLDVYRRTVRAGGAA